MTDESSSRADKTSPWSGEVPIPSAPVEFTWAAGDDRPASPDSPADTARDASGSVSAGHSALRSAGVDRRSNGGATADPDDQDARRRQRRQILTGVGVSLLVVVGWLAFGRGDGAEDSAAGDPAAAGADTVPSALDVDDSLPAADEPATTEPEVDGDGGGDDDAGAGDGDPGRSGSTDDGAEWRQDTVELPQVLLDSTVSFDIVALTSSGDYVEIDVPSGRADALQLGAGTNGAIVAGQTATLFSSYSSNPGGRLLRVGEPSIELSLPSNVDVTQVGAVGDEFVGYAYGNNGDPRSVRILPDGAVVTTDVDDGDFGGWQRQFAPDGAALVTDAGGVYREGEAGFERISNGFLIAASSNHLLARECDDAMVCGYVTIDFETGERVDTAISANSLGSFGFDSAQVSPDGRWLRYIQFSDNATGDVLIDLTTGERTELDSGRPGPAGRVWAGDSSGFFRSFSASGFEFYEIATGETFTFGEQFGRAVSLDIRITAGQQTGRTIRAATTTGLSLIALTESGDVAQIDVDSGAVITTDGPGLDSSAPVTIFPDAAGAVLTSYDNVPSVRFRADDRTAVAVDGPSPGGPLWPGPTLGTVWQTGDDPDVLALELVDAQGNDLGERIEFDAVGVNGVIGADGRGGVVVDPGLGGVFALSAATLPERITGGELLAINATAAYVRECDEAAQCGVFVVDRATGVRTITENTGFDRAGEIAGRGVPSGQNVSPDGTIAFVRDAKDPSRCLMIDTTASPGAWTGVPCVDLASPIIWTPDTAYAVWLDDGRITVYERSTRSVRVVNTVELRAIAAVPVGAPAT